jgi:hypothetical protein
MKFSTTGIVITFVIVIIVSVVVVKQRRLNDLRENGVLVNVKIVDILTPAKGAGSFNYRCSFNYGGKQNILISPTSVKEHGSKYIGKFCPAVYSPKGNNLRVLLRSEDFEEYNIPLTDSLIEVINSINR